MKQKVTQKGLLPYDSGVVTIKTGIRVYFAILMCVCYNTAAVSFN